MSENLKKKIIHNIRTQVDSFGRKKYKLEEVIGQQNQQQDHKEKNQLIDTGRYKSMLIGRDEGLNIEKYVGKLESNKKTTKKQVFYCQVCKEGFKCDIAYITHLNSQSHNRKLGMNMKVKNVSLQSVSSKINSLIQKKSDKNNSESSQIEKNLLKQLKKNEQQSDQNEQNDQNDSQLGKNNKKINQKTKKQTKIQQTNQVKKNQQDKEDQQQAEADQDQQAELEMMKQLGLPTSFGSKKQKR